MNMFLRLKLASGCEFSQTDQFDPIQLANAEKILLTHDACAGGEVIVGADEASKFAVFRCKVCKETMTTGFSSAVQAMRKVSLGAKTEYAAGSHAGDGCVYFQK